MSTATIISGLLLLMVVPSVAARETVTPTVIISPDSVSFEIPLANPNDAWDVSFRVFEWMGWERDGIVTLNVRERSFGPLPPDGQTYHYPEARLAWLGERCGGIAETSPDSIDGGVRCTFGPFDEIARLRPFEPMLRVRHTDGSIDSTGMTVIRFPDPRNEEARALAGSLSEDECIIYRLVLDPVALTDSLITEQFITHDGIVRKQIPNYDTRGRIVVTPTLIREPYEWETSLFPKLGASRDCVANYLQRRSEAVDLTSLDRLGYTFVDSDTLMQAWRRKGSRLRSKKSITVTAIGFNAAHDEALVFVREYAAEMIRLDKVDGEWMIGKRARALLTD